MEGRIVVFSDTHGYREAMENVRKAASHFAASALLSAGDLCPDPHDPLWWGVMGVRGNCDRFHEYGNLPFPPLCSTLDYGKRKLYVTHGDRMYSGDFPLKKGDVYISGHTHVPKLCEEGGIYYLNPGSSALPRSSSGPTAALLSEDGIVLFSLLDFTQISAMAFSRE